MTSVDWAKNELGTPLAANHHPPKSDLRATRKQLINRRASKELETILD